MLRYFKIFFLLLGCFFATLGLSAQNIISGKVIDKNTRKALEGASVLMCKENENAIISYAITNAQGEYELKIKDNQTANFRIDFSILGYAKQSVNVENENRLLNVELTQETINLQEVVVRANKIWKSRDTLNYSVASFKTMQDRVIGDVLKKMPGIEVAQSGAISYNGKPINKFYVEGSDVVDGKYGLVTKNVPADAVSKVQVLENHQPIKALENNTFSEDAAINLILKDGAKSRWIGKADAGVGTTPFLWDGRLMGMRIGRGQQSINVYKTNNIGNGLEDELLSHTNSFSSVTSGNRVEQNWLSLVTPSSPSLSESRTLFNTSHLLSSNNLWKLPKDFQLRASLNYLYDQQTQETEARTVYYLESDSSLTISEFQNNARYRNQLDAGVALTANKSDYYLQNNLKTRLQWNNANAHIWNSATTIGQKLQTPNHYLTNEFQWVKTKKVNTFQLISNTTFSQLPQSLLVSPGLYETIFNDGNAYESLRQEISFTSFTTNNYALFRTRKKNWRMELRAGFRAQIQQLNSELFAIENNQALPAADSLTNDFSFRQYRYLLQPQFGYEARNLRINFNLPVSYNVANGEDRLLFSPSVSLNYDLDAYWNLRLYGGLNNSLDDIRTMIPNGILRNYRSLRSNIGEQMHNIGQNYSFGLTYRNTVKAFFAHFTANYSKGKTNLLYDSFFDGILSRVTSVVRTGHSESWSVNGNFSKELFDWNTTFWLDMGYSQSTSEQLQQQRLLRYSSNTLSLRPKILMKLASWTNVEYEGMLARSQMKILESVVSRSEPMFNMSHFLTWNLFFSQQFQCYARFEYFYNHAANTTYPTVLFADAGMRYLWKKFEFALDIKNIFNTKRYEYAMFGSLSESFNAYELRPISALAKVSWTF